MDVIIYCQGLWGRGDFLLHVEMILEKGFSRLFEILVRLRSANGADAVSVFCSVLFSSREIRCLTWISHHYINRQFWRCIDPVNYSQICIFLCCLDVFSLRLPLTIASVTFTSIHPVIPRLSYLIHLPSYRSLSREHSFAFISC